MEHRYKLDNQNIAKRVKSARKLMGITQEELAERVYLSTNAIAKLESNIMAPSLQTLVNIANVLNVDINYLLLNDDESAQSETSLDAFLKSQIQGLSATDKEFIIHVINGLKLYSKNEK